MSARKCEVKGCTATATWERFFGGRMAHVCGNCRRKFQSESETNPRLEEVAKDAGPVPAAAVDTVPKVRPGSSVDDA